MEILTTRNFNGVALDCYKGNDNNDFWATREQIGQLLGYSHPEIAIGKIHNRNADRLNKFSTLTKMGKVEGNRTVTREMIVYNFRGLLEICRWSNQPKADAVMDFLWDVADDIRKHGMYISDKLREAAQVDKKAFDAVVNKYLAEKEKVKALETQIAEEAAYVTLGKVVLSLPGSVTVADAAQFLAQHGVEIGRNRLYKLGRDKKLLYSSGKRKNKPTQKGIESGIVNLELDQNGSYQLSTRTMLTAQGLKNLFNELFSATYPLFPEPEVPEEEM